MTRSDNSFASIIDDDPYQKDDVGSTHVVYIKKSECILACYHCKKGPYTANSISNHFLKCKEAVSHHRNVDEKVASKIVAKRIKSVKRAHHKYRTSEASKRNNHISKARRTYDIANPPPAETDVSVVIRHMFSVNDIAASCITD